MSLKNDIDEVLELWKTAGWLTKVLMALGLFLSVSSIASVADVIFHWKGFIQQGIEFYQVWIRQPIASLFHWLTVPINPDAVIAPTIALSIYFKTNSNDPTDFSWAKWAGKLILWIAIVILVSRAFALYLPTLASFLNLVLILVGISFIYDQSRKERIAYFTYVGLVFLGLFLLGAINVGLTRTA